MEILETVVDIPANSPQGPKPEDLGTFRSESTLNSSVQRLKLCPNRVITKDMTSNTAANLSYNG